VAIFDLADIVVNAREFSERDGSQNVLVSMRDWRGPYPENIDHIFDVFYTTKSRGVGMRLAGDQSVDHRGP